MRKNLATALLAIVVLYFYSQPFLRQNLATGIESNQLRWNFLFTYQHGCYKQYGTDPVTPINDIRGMIWYYNEKQCVLHFGDLGVKCGECKEKTKSGRVNIPTLQFVMG